jgi:hypothetical protein
MPRRADTADNGGPKHANEDAGSAAASLTIPMAPKSAVLENQVRVFDERRIFLSCSVLAIG